MNLNFYHYVTVIAESGSLSTASERLFITQSALTQALKKMEQTFGGPLFLYQNRSMQITPLGQIVLETARAIEDAKLEMTNAIARPETAAKHLSVAVNVQTGALLMGKVFAQFHHRYPDLMVHFLTTTTNSAKRLLEQKAVGHRKEDIVGWAELFLGKLQKLHGRYLHLSQGAWQHLQEYEWPGNLAQLYSFLQRLLTESPRRMVDELYLDSQLEIMPIPESYLSDKMQKTVYCDPRAVKISQILQENSGNRTAAAKALGISTTTLWRYMKKYRIDG